MRDDHFAVAVAEQRQHLRRGEHGVDGVHGGADFERGVHGAEVVAVVGRHEPQDVARPEASQRIRREVARHAIHVRQQLLPRPRVAGSATYDCRAGG